MKVKLKVNTISIESESENRIILFIRLTPGLIDLLIYYFPLEWFQDNNILGWGGYIRTELCFDSIDENITRCPHGVKQ